MPGAKQFKPAPEKQAIGITFFFLIAFIVHLLDIFLRLSGSNFGYYHNIFWFYFLLGIWAALGPLKDETKNAISNVLFYLGLTILAYTIPLVNLIIRDFGFTDTIGQNILEGIILFAPLWLVYLMYVHGSAFTQKLGFIYFTFWIVLLIFNYTEDIKNATNDVEINGFNPGRLIEYVLDQFWSGTKTVFSSTISVIKSIPDSIGKWWEGTICYATARDDCQGKIDPTKDFIGVNIQDITSTLSFYQGRPVRLPFLVKARALSSQVEINLSCKSTNPGGDVNGIIKPKSGFVIETIDTLQEQVDCEVNPEDQNNKLDLGSHELKVVADFSFQTQARLVQYFTDEARLKSLRIKKQDPLVVYKEFIQEPNPIAIYSNGPIKIGMGLGKLQPIGIDTQEEDFIGTITINIFNNWNGKVKKFNDLFIVIPKGFNIVEINSEEFGQDWSVDCEGDISELNLCSDVEQVIKIPEIYMKDITQGNGAAIFIDYKIPNNEYLTILEQGIPISTKYFKVFIDYDYILEHKRSFNIIKSPGDS